MPGCSENVYYYSIIHPEPLQHICAQTQTRGWGRKVALKYRYIHTEKHMIDVLYVCQHTHMYTCTYTYEHTLYVHIMGRQVATYFNTATYFNILQHIIYTGLKKHTDRAT